MPEPPHLRQTGSAPMARICPECGADTWKAESYDRAAKENQRLRREAERQAAENGVLAYKLRVAEIENREREALRQRKVRSQAKVIRRLERRLRAVAVSPHEGVHPSDASGVMQPEGSARPIRAQQEGGS